MKFWTTLATFALQYVRVKERRPICPVFDFLTRDRGQHECIEEERKMPASKLYIYIFIRCSTAVVFLSSKTGRHEWQHRNTSAPPHRLLFSSIIHLPFFFIPSAHDFTSAFPSRPRSQENAVLLFEQKKYRAIGAFTMCVCFFLSYCPWTSKCVGLMASAFSLFLFLLLLLILNIW